MQAQVRLTGRVRSVRARTYQIWLICQPILLIRLCGTQGKDMAQHIEFIVFATYRTRAVQTQVCCYLPVSDLFVIAVHLRPITMSG